MKRKVTKITESRSNALNPATLCPVARAAAVVGDRWTMLILRELFAESHRFEEIQAQSEKIEAEARDWDKRSDDQMHLHHRWAQATTALQVSIALAAIALLTRKKWLEYGMFALGAVGLGIGAMAVAHV